MESETMVTLFMSLFGLQRNCKPMIINMDRDGNLHQQGFWQHMSLEELILLDSGYAFFLSVSEYRLASLL